MKFSIILLLNTNNFFALKIKYYQMFLLDNAVFACCSTLNEVLYSNYSKKRDKKGELSGYTFCIIHFVIFII